MADRSMPSTKPCAATSKASLGPLLRDTSLDNSLGFHVGIEIYDSPFPVGQPQIYKGLAT